MTIVYDVGHFLDYLDSVAKQINKLVDKRKAVTKRNKRSHHASSTSHQSSNKICLGARSINKTTRQRSLKSSAQYVANDLNSNSQRKSSQPTLRIVGPNKEVGHFNYVNSYNDPNNDICCNSSVSADPIDNNKVYFMKQYEHLSCGHSDKGDSVEFATNNHSLYENRNNLSESQITTNGSMTLVVGGQVNSGNTVEAMQIESQSKITHQYHVQDDIDRQSQIGGVAPILERQQATCYQGSYALPPAQQFSYCQCFDCMNNNKTSSSVCSSLTDSDEQQTISGVQLPEDYTGVHLRNEAHPRDIYHQHHLSKDGDLCQLSASSSDMNYKLQTTALYHGGAGERSVSQANDSTQPSNCPCCQTTSKSVTTYDSTMQQQQLQTVQPSVDSYPVYYQDFVTGY